MQNPLAFTPAVLLLLLAAPAAAYHGACVARSARRAAPTTLKAGGARAGVLGRLIPGIQNLQPAPALYSQKKRYVLRWRAAQARAAVQRASNEIEALNQRVGNTVLAEEARLTRISALRTEAGVAESRIILLKAKQREMGMPARTGWLGEAARTAEIFWASEERSARVVLNTLSQVKDPWALMREDTVALLRLGSNAELVKGYAALKDAPRLVTHASAIAARSSVLERYAPGILVALDGHLDAVEPHLDEILEKLDEIEPHLPFVLENLPTLAPHCGALIKHIDALLLYADDGGKYLDPLLPYVERFAPLLDLLGPHLALLRPHMRRLLPLMPVVAPHAHRFARQLVVSANADVLLYYFGWVLRVPWVGSWVLSLPFMPRLAAFLCKRLWRRPVRGRTCDYICDWDECDVKGFTSEMAAGMSASYMQTTCAEMSNDSYDSKRKRVRGTSALLQRAKAAS